jgi:hypothetical protein
MFAFVAFDLVLGIVGRGVMDVTFVGEVAMVRLDDHP